MSVYKTNRLKARTTNTQPTLTDQSQARETDINVIVGRYGVTGRAPGAAGQPMFGDFSDLPTTLRDMIETSRDMQRRRNQLPEQLREMPIEQLLALTPDKLTDILKPMEEHPPAPLAPPNEETK